jgi:hypothetical protein
MIKTDRQIAADWVEKNTCPEFIEDFINSFPIVSKEFLVETILEANMIQKIIDSVNDNIVIMVHGETSHELNTNTKNYIFYLSIEDVLTNEIFIKKTVTKHFKKEI